MGSRKAINLGLEGVEAKKKGKYKRGIMKSWKERKQ